MAQGESATMDQPSQFIEENSDEDDSSEEDEYQNQQYLMEQSRKQTMRFKQTEFKSDLMASDSRIQSSSSSFLREVEENNEENRLTIKISEKPQRTMNLNQKKIKVYRLTRDGQYLLIVDESNNIKIFNMTNQLMIGTYDFFKKNSLSICMIRDFQDSSFFIAGEDRILRVYNCQKMAVERQFPVKRMHVYASAIFYEKNLLAVGGTNLSRLSVLGKKTTRRQLKMYRIDKDFKLQFKVSLPQQENVITHLEFSNDSAQSNTFTILAAITQNQSKPDANRPPNLIFIRLAPKQKPEIIYNVSLGMIGIQSVFQFFFCRYLNKFVSIQNTQIPGSNNRDGQPGFYTFSLIIKND